MTTLMTPEVTTAETPNATACSVQQCVERALDNYFAQVGDAPVAGLYDMLMAEIEAPLLECIMAYTNNNQSEAARVLGISRGTLRKKLKIYNLLD